MARKSKREIERALEDLDGVDSPPVDDERLADQYPEPVYEFTLDVSRTLISKIYTRELGRLSGPERTLRYLEIIRLEYDIDTERDDAVLAFLETADVRSPLAFALAAQYGHEALSGDETERFRELMDTDESAASTLLVQRGYALMADLGEGVRVSA